MNHRAFGVSSPSELCRILLRHKKKLVLFVLSVMVLTGVVTIKSPRTYRSDGKLFVRLGRENVGLDATATFGQTPMVAVPYSREDEINSIVELIKSRRLSERVVDSVGADVVLGQETSWPWDKLKNSIVSAVREFLPANSSTTALAGTSQYSLSGPAQPATVQDRAIAKFEEKRGLTAVKKTNVIQVSYEAPSPQLAQAVVSKLIEEYLKEHVRIHRAAGARQFLDEQVARLHRQLADSEESLRSLQQRSGIANPELQQQMLVSRLGRLEDDLLETEVALRASLAEARLLKASLGGVSQLQVTRSAGSDNAVTDSVRQQLYELQLQEQKLLATFTPEHYQVKQIRRQIAGVQSLLAYESGAVSRGEASAPETAPEDGDSDDQLVKNEPALQSLQVKKEWLEQQVVEVKSELDRFQRDQLEIARLQREISLQDASYRSYAASLEQANIDRSLQDERISNVEVFQAATYNPKPISPRTLLNLALGSFCALAGGIGLVMLLEMSDRTLKTPVEIEDVLGLPNLATIPRLRINQLKLKGSHFRR